MVGKSRSFHLALSADLMGVDGKSLFPPESLQLLEGVTYAFLKDSTWSHFPSTTHS